MFHPIVSEEYYQGRLLQKLSRFFETKVNSGKTIIGFKACTLLKSDGDRNSLIENQIVIVESSEYKVWTEDNFPLICFYFSATP